MGLSGKHVEQLRAILDFIHRRRNIQTKDTKFDYGAFFPRVSKKDLNILKKESINAKKLQESEGVILQIAMDTETANELCYAAHPFGSP